MSREAKTLGVMTVAVRTNNLGEIVGIYSDLPIRVVKISGSGGGGEIPVAAVAEMSDVDFENAHDVLTPWGHLTKEQLDTIEKTAAADMLGSCKEDPRFLAGVVSARVAEMSVEDKLESISSDEDEVARSLGFYPETGDAYRVNRDEGDE